MFSRITASALTLIAASLLSPQSASAQVPSVGGRTPADIVAIVSISDVSACWNNATATTLGQSIADGARARVRDNPALAEQLADVEKKLGIPFGLGPVMTDLVSRADIYLIEKNGETELALSLRLHTTDFVPQLYAALKQEAASAIGVARGVPASTVEETTIGGMSVLSLPAFDIHLASSGDVLLYATSRSVLETSISNTGGPFLISDGFRAYFSELSNEPGQIWYWGDVSKLNPIIGDLIPDPTNTFNTLTNAAGKIDVQRGRVRTAHFVPLSQLPPAKRRAVLASPPPDGLGTVRFLPRESLAVYATNYFDGGALIEATNTVLRRSRGLERLAFDIDDQLVDARQRYGFDPVTDLFPIMGPSFSMALTAETDGEKPFGVIAVADIKDRARLQAALGFIEDAYTPVAPAAPAGGEAPPPPPNPVQKEDVNGTTVTSIDGVRLAWGLGSEERIYLATSAELIKSSLTNSANSASNFAGSTQLSTTTSYRPAEANTLIASTPRTLASRLEGVLEGKTRNPEDAEVVREIMSTLEMMTSNTTNSPAGAKRVTVLMLK